jgi:hypothetical protein
MKPTDERNAKAAETSSTLGPDPAIVAAGDELWLHNVVKWHEEGREA